MTWRSVRSFKQAEADDHCSSEVNGLFLFIRVCVCVCEVSNHHAAITNDNVHTTKL